MDHLLEVSELTTVFPSDEGDLTAVDCVSLTVDRGEILTLVGESGCGKSMTALSIMGLVPSPGRVTGGKVLLDGVDLQELPPEGFRRLRGDRMSMVFQEPMSALNPVFTVGDQVAEVLSVHRGMDHRAALEKATELFSRVGIPDPSRRTGDYPHQMSGGMQQRVLIAMAVACEPDLLIADEPTTALDVTVQAQILRLMERLIREENRGALLITHDLGVVAGVADRVCIMYAGAVVEVSSVGDLFRDPQHPYTRGLLASLPAPGRRTFRSIPGAVPDLRALPDGCRFNPRCPRAQAICLKVEPGLLGDADRQVRCHFPGSVHDGLDQPHAAAGRGGAP